jgi:Tol biopolymer transport system component
MRDVESHVVPGTAEIIPTAAYPDVVISPDGREVAFFRGPPGKLLRVPIEGGTPLVVADVAPVFPYGLSWEPDGTMFYGQPDGIWRVSQSGGAPEHVVKTQAPEQVYGPHLLPGGEWVLFTSTKAGGVDRWTKADIVVQSLKSGERRVLRSAGFDARYLSTGHITYIADGALVASRFDVDTLKLGEERVALVQGIRTADPPAGGSGFYAIANNGTLAFIPDVTRPPSVARPQKRLVWVDRAGNATPLAAPPQDYTMARLSPDERRIALVVGSALPLSDPPPDIYVFDLETENLAQLTFDSRADDGPVWSRDGSRIYYRSGAEDESASAVFTLPAEGGAPDLLVRGRRAMPWSISPDGNTLLLVDAKSLDDVDLSTIDVRKGGGLEPLLDLAESVSEPALSPNGQWLVHSGSAAAREVALRPFPGVTQQRRLVGLGTHPVFSADGSELFVFDGDGISVASVQYSPLRLGALRKLFSGPYWYGVGSADGDYGRAWDVDSKNNRFLMIALPEEAPRSVAPPPQVQINVVLNWFEELEKRVPAR